MIKSAIGDLTLRKVEEEDKSTVIHIKQEAARWLENKGIHQWAGILIYSKKENDSLSSISIRLCWRMICTTFLLPTRSLCSARCSLRGRCRE